MSCAVRLLIGLMAIAVAFILYREPLMDFAGRIASQVQTSLDSILTVPDGDNNSTNNPQTDSCADVNSKVIIGECSCGNRNKGSVWCDVTVRSGSSGCTTNSAGVTLCDSGTGQGWIPKECTKCP